jgi:hypothetical protein
MNGRRWASQGRRLDVGGEAPDPAITVLASFMSRASS